MSVADSTPAAEPSAQKPMKQGLKKQTSCRFVGGPMYFEDQVYPKPNNHFTGPVILIWTAVSIWYFAYVGWHEPTVLGYLKALAWHAPPYILDMITSDAHWYNVKRLNYHGYSNLLIYSNMTYNFFTCLFGMFMTPAQYRLEYPDMVLINDQDWITPWFWIRLMMRLSIMFVISDLLFYTLHSWLHRYLAKLHFMHHICVKTSITTAIIIHPIDFLIEGVGNMFSAWLMWAVFRDPLAHIIAAPLAVSWYHSGHDEWFQNLHARHHANCNSDYWAYNPAKTRPDSKDVVRVMVFEHDTKANKFTKHD